VNDACRSQPVEDVMLSMLIALAAAAQVFYEAQVPTFGCNSSREVAQLQSLRSDTKAFQTRLYSQVFQGQCMPIAKGAVVDGMVEADDTSVLRVQRQADPPGYMAPIADFKIKPLDEKK
jgi:hypothetical protein